MNKFLDKASLTTGWIKTALVSVFSIWMIAVLFGTLNDENLNPWGLTAALIKLGLLLAIVVLIVFKTRLWELIKSKQKILIIALVTAAVAWQLIVVLNASTSIGWDVWSVHTSLSDSKLATLYLSENPNNTFLFFFQYLILKTFNLSHTWLNVNFINLICLDLSLIINVFFQCGC